jgi:DNA invertase Pin-like site-specific DNA recombinase
MKPKPTKKTRVLGYSRVSTSKQDVSPEVQHKMAKAWYDSQVIAGTWPNGSEWLDMLFDEVSSKINLLERPKGQLIPTILERGDVLIISRSDRAFRSAADCEYALTQLAGAGIRVVFLNLPIDTGTAEGMLMASVMAAFSRYEREAIRWRTKAALDRMKAEGYCTNKPHAGWMLRGPKKPGVRRKIVPDNRYRQIAEWMAMRLVETRSYHPIAEETWKYFRQWKMKGPMPHPRIKERILRWVLDFPQMTEKEVRDLVAKERINNARLVEMVEEKLAKRKLKGISYADPNPSNEPGT